MTGPQNVVSKGFTPKIQKALFVKNFWYKWNNLIFSLSALLLPALMVSMIFILTMISSMMENLKELNYADPKFDNCPGFMGGWFLESVLPEDDTRSKHDWVMSGYPCTDNSCYPGLTEPLFAENYPNGVTEKICRDDVVDFLEAVPKKIDSVNQLSYWLSLFEWGEGTSDVKVTYTIKGEENAPKTPPILVQWLEDFVNVNYQNLLDDVVTGVPIILTNFYSDEDGNQIPIVDESDAKLALQVLLFTNVNNCDKVQSNDNWEHCYNQKEPIIISEPSTPEKPLQITKSYESLSGPGLTSKFKLHYKSETSNQSGQDPEGEYYKSELLNIHYEKDDTILTLRPMMTYEGYLSQTAWTGGLINKPFFHQMQTGWTEWHKNAWYQTDSSADKYGYMDLYPLVNVSYNDRRITEKNGNLSTQLKKAETIPTDLFVETLTKWYVKTFNRIKLNENVLFQPWFKDDGPITIHAAETPWTESEKQLFTQINTLIIAPICYAVHALDDVAITDDNYDHLRGLKDRGDLVKSIFPLFADASAVTLEDFTSQVTQFFEEYKMKGNNLEMDAIPKYVARLTEVFAARKKYWDERWYHIGGDNYFEDLDTKQAMAFGYWWSAGKIAWFQFWDNGDQTGYVETNNLDDNGFPIIAKVACDPQRMSDLQLYMIGFWETFDSEFILLIHRMLVSINGNGLPRHHELSIPDYDWLVDTRVLGVKEVSFPHPLSAYNSLPLFLYQSAVPYMIIVIGVLPLMANYLRLFIDDRQRFMFQYLSIMGISPTQYWLSYYALACTEITVISCLQAVVMTILFQGNFFLVWVAFWLSDLHLILFGLILSSGFRSTSSATIVGCFMTLMFIQVWVLGLFLGIEFSAAINYTMILLLPMFGSCWASFFILIAGIWTECESNATSCEIVGLDSRAANGMIIAGIYFNGLIVSLAASCVLYFFIAHYLLLVFPRDGSTPLPWHFPFSILLKKETDEANLEKKDQKNEFYFEYENEEKQKLLSLNNVTKRFKNPKKVQSERGDYFYAVNDVSFDIYEGEVVVLLGHNGAGKTTLMSMLTGQLEMSGGSISVAGHDVTVNTTSARKFIGFCPQFDVQWDYMTTRDHLYFAAIVKGEENVEKAILDAAKLLDLTAKLDFKVCDLSGGQRRRVSIGMAVIGENTKLLILDEPSTGIDPATRRSLWSCIRKLQMSRGILITTHFMDECDYLADRTAIMAHGQLKGFGTPQQLKTAMNSGYTLTVTKIPGSFNKENLELILSDTVPIYSLRNDIALEIVYNIPKQHTVELQHVLEQFEIKNKELGISNYAIGISSIEDVFLELGSHNESAVSDVKDLGYDVFAKYAKFIDNNVFNNFKNQLYALFYKRSVYFLNSTRDILLGLLGSALYFSIIGAAISALIDEGTPKAITTSDTEYYDTFTNVDLKGNQRFIMTNSGTASTVFEEDAPIILQCMSEKGYEGDYVENSDDLHGKMIKDMYESWHNNRFHLPLFFAIDVKSYEFPDTYGIPEDDDGSPSFDIDLYHSPAYYWSFGMAYTAFTQCVYSINNSISEPLPQVRMQPDIRKMGGTSMTLSLQENVLGSFFAMAILFGTCCWSISVIEERNSNSKHLQMLSGIKMWLYWFVQMSFDYGIYFVSLWLAILVQFLVGSNLTDDIGTFGAAFITMLLYPLSDIPRAFFMSNFISSPAIAILTSLLYTQILSIAAIFLPSVLYDKDFVPEIDLAFSILFPPYNLSSHLAQITSSQASCPYNRNETPDEYSIYCTDQLDMSDTVYTETSLHPFGWYLWTWCCSCIIWWSIFLSTEYIWTHPYVFKRLKFWSNTDNMENEFDEPFVASVQKEADIVKAKQGTVKDNELLVLDELRKEFPGKRRLLGKNSPGKVAVESLSLIVPDGQCFGFLGVNGAGKSTTVNMLTALMAPTSGCAKFAGQNIETAGQKLYNMVSYCPQFNGLLEFLTARQILWFYANAARIQFDKINEFVNEIIESLGIQEYADRQCGTYSGGNKRKLSVALAFMGEPKVVFLDEPSSGVDPASRRKLWNMIINTTRFGNRCVILTTHSMDECEALCDRLTIMKSGRMMCLGTPSEVKSTVGRGHMVELFLESDAYDELDRSWSTGVDKVFRAFQDQFNNSCKLNEVNSNRIRLTISKDVSTVLSLFDFLANHNQDLRFKNYTVSDCSLEAVFVALNEAEGKSERSDDDIAIDSNSFKLDDAISSSESSSDQ